jgi:hypothetical protein
MPYNNGASRVRTMRQQIREDLDTLARIARE